MWKISSLEQRVEEITGCGLWVHLEGPDLWETTDQLTETKGEEDTV